MKVKLNFGDKKLNEPLELTLSNNLEPFNGELFLNFGKFKKNYDNLNVFTIGVEGKFNNKDVSFSLDIKRISDEHFNYFTSNWMDKLDHKSVMTSLIDNNIEKIVKELRIELTWLNKE